MWGERAPVALKLRTDRVGRRDQSPQGLALDLKGRRSQRKGRGSTPDGPQASERGTRSAAKDASRAIPLSWEIKDFPTHGEPQAVCAGVGPLSVPARCRLREQCCERLGPWPYRQLPFSEVSGSFRERLASQRLCSASASLRKSGKRRFPDFRNLATGCGLGALLGAARDTSSDELGIWEFSSASFLTSCAPP